VRDYVYIFVCVCVCLCVCYICARRIEALAHCVRVCVCVRARAWGRPLAAAQWAPLFSRLISITVGLKCNV